MKWILGIVSVLIIVAAVALFVIPAKAPAGPTQPPPAQIADLIVVDSPVPNGPVSSPLTVSGQARGNWFFEATAPYELRDAAGTVIAQGTLRADNWMTSDFTPFNATITFTPQEPGTHGMLVLKNDNPSGDPAKQQELDVPVVFR